MTGFMIWGRSCDGEPLSLAAGERHLHTEYSEEDEEVEEIRIVDPDADGGPARVPRTRRPGTVEEGPPHYGWEEVYGLNGCNPDLA